MLIFRRFNDWLSVFIQTVCQYFAVSICHQDMGVTTGRQHLTEDQYLTCKMIFVLHQDLQSGNGKSVEDMTESLSPEDQLKIWKQKLLRIQ